MAGLHLITLLGLALAAVGAGVLAVPRVTRRLLLVVGIRWRESEYDRVAGWLLVVLGLVIALLGRALR